MDKKFSIGKIILLILLILIILGTIVAGALASSVLAVVEETPPVDFSEIGKSLGQASEIVGEDGKLIEEVKSENYRETVSIDAIPKHVRDAFVAIEDERFYTHPGVDIQGIVKSAIDNIVAGGLVRGGSTITQQLARDLYLNNEKTFDRKIKEAYIAIKMDQALSKEEILEIYLNRVFLGQNSYGVQSAAKNYYSKDVSELSLAEAASLASMPQAPTAYSLYNTVTPDQVEDTDQIISEISLNGDLYYAVYNPKFEDRKNYVLDKMLELGMISEEENRSAKATDLASQVNPPNVKDSSLSNYFTQLIKDQVVEALMEKYNMKEDDALDKLYNGGLKITSTLDMDMQDGLMEDFENFVDTAANQTGNNWGEARLMDLSYDDFGNILNGDGQVLYFAKNNLFDEEGRLKISSDFYEYRDGSLHIDQDLVYYKDGSLIISPFYTTLDGNLRTHRSSTINIPEDEMSLADDSTIAISNSFLESHPDFLEEVDGTIYIGANNFKLDEEGTIQPQASVVVMDHNNGHIKALIGGRGSKKGINRSYQSFRQPGSSIKPLSVYTPALDNDMTLASPIDDIPHYSGEELWPVNWYGEYRGITTLRRSLETSSNVNAVKALEDLGIEKSKEYLEKFNIINGDDPEADNFISKEENPENNDENTGAMALGALTHGLTNLEMTSAYAAIANSGNYTKPLAFAKVEDNTGRVILEGIGQSHKVVDEGVAFLVQDAMRSATDNGVASYAKVPGFDVAGKTGTSGTADTNTDFWYVGYTPYYTVGVWMGADNQQLKLNSISAMTTSIFSQVNKYILDGMSPKKFTKPSSIVEVEVCNQSGLLPGDACWSDPRHTVITEYFVKGSEPKKECDVHVFRTINANDGLLATEDTPNYVKEVRSFITRKIEYDPADNDGIVPTDWQYMAPTAYSQEKSQGLFDDFLDLITEEDENTEDSEVTEETENTEYTEDEITDTEIDQTEPDPGQGEEVYIE